MHPVTDRLMTNLALSESLRDAKHSHNHHDRLIVVVYTEPTAHMTGKIGKKQKSAHTTHGLYANMHCTHNNNNKIEHMPSCLEINLLINAKDFG